MKVVRCAIYTRKSSDEGLEQAFNSLDAQREACAAYVLSQASEGWVALPDIYDDGGLSGGTLERPALKRLLAEVAAGRVDIIVVYKVDRLTRSLFDFAKLVETLDAASTSFVSVTQSFNTTTSMGRLTLNMLLSFAQFEREVTAERIRDKIAASKAKGMWMGGTPPLGYAPAGRTLEIVEPHAVIIRHLFARYLVLGNVRRLAEELTREGVLSPVRSRLSDTTFGGGRFCHGQLYAILRNPVYVARIRHAGHDHVGRHPAIIDTGIWDQTQTLLDANRTGTRNRVRASSPSLLAGKVTADGKPLVTSHANKNGRRYRYYISAASAPGEPAVRIPAIELEAAVTECVARAFDDPFALAGLLGVALTHTAVSQLGRHAASVAHLLRKRHRETVVGIVESVCIHDRRIDISCSASAIAGALHLERDNDAPDTVTLAAEVTLTRTGRALRLVQGNGATLEPLANPSLVKLLVRARRWWKILREGQLDTRQLAAAEGVEAAYVTRVVRLAFLSPTVIDALLKGTLRAGINGTTITAPGAIDASWREQARTMLPQHPPLGGNA